MLSGDVVLNLRYTGAQYCTALKAAVNLFFSAAFIPLPSQQPHPLTYCNSIELLHASSLSLESPSFPVAIFFVECPRPGHRLPRCEN